MEWASFFKFLLTTVQLIFLGGFIILCVYGVWIGIAQVHRYMYRNYKSYKLFIDNE